MGFKDIFGQVIGVESNERTNKHGETKEELLHKAGHDLFKGSKEVGEAALLGAETVYDYTAQKAADAAAYSRVKLGEGAEIAKEKAAQGADYLGNQMYDAAGVLKEKTAEGAAKSGEFLADQGERAWESTKEYSALMAEKAKQEAAEQYENAKGLASDAAQYSQQKIAEGVEQIPDLTHATYQLAGNSFRRFRDEAGNLWEHVEDAAGTYYERMVSPASERVADKAGNYYQYYKDASGKEGRRLLNKAGQASDEAQKEAHGLFHSAYDGLAHISHSIGSVFSHGKEDAVDSAKQAYDASADQAQRLAHSGRQYAEEAAANLNAGYEHAKEQVQPHHSWWPSFLSGGSKSNVFDQKKWDRYFTKNKHLNANEWKAYFQDSNINPAHWVEYMDAYQKGPRGLNAFWRKVERQGHHAKGAIQGQYYAAKDGAHHGAQRYLGAGNDEIAAAPVSLFWTAVLALYLLVLAKRVFEQKRLLVSHEKDGRDTPASSAAEKMRLSDVARASSDSLSNFAIYAPATAVVLLTHELQNAASPYVLHGLYAALFAGQILQNEATYASTAKARGAGIYLSWAAAGLAGAFGITSSLTGFHL